MPVCTDKKSRARARTSHPLERAKGRTLQALLRVWVVRRLRRVPLLRRLCKRRTLGRRLSRRFRGLQHPCLDVATQALQMLDGAVLHEIGRLWVGPVASDKIDEAEIGLGKAGQPVEGIEVLVQALPKEVAQGAIGKGVAVLEQQIV